MHEPETFLNVEFFTCDHAVNSVSNLLLDTEMHACHLLPIQRQYSHENILAVVKEVLGSYAHTTLVNTI